MIKSLFKGLASLAIVIVFLMGMTVVANGGSMPNFLVLAAGGVEVPAAQSVTVTNVNKRFSLDAGCRVIHEYNLLPDMNHVSSSGSQIHVQFYFYSDANAGEWETVLPTAGVAGGRWNVTPPSGRYLRGFVWEYADCTNEQVISIINPHIERRLAGEFPNKGYIPWNQPHPESNSVLFVPHKLTGSTPPAAPSGTGTTPPAPTKPGAAAAPAKPSGSSAPANCEAKVDKRSPAVGTTWSLKSDGPMIVNFWTNEPGKDQKERKLLLAPGTNVLLKGGGTSFAYATGCDSVTQKEFDANSLPTVTFEQLKAEGLVG
jgi:hypothetical protein